METTILSIEQLSCPSCVRKIESGILRIPGVESVQVKFNAGKVKVTFDASHTNTTEIKHVVEQLGYVVR
ncbi:heavy-metal-associated domain-containing protein [Amphibacillus sediminis]|uniref:heavy-metal-associated domain-containing protein n=1 Tax=Amphibacillus sediminis TaxID=360185 RepID=UPI00082D8DD1|nr:heavy metal-associated domain-containing protein [Amphibacillus sediminis]